MKSPFQEKSLFFAPMEGITDPTYRSLIHEIYPEWDYMATDFLRLPSQGLYPAKHVMKHFGHENFNSPQKSKTIYQVLAAPNSIIKHHIELIGNQGFDWIDINLGCPSKTVCKNQGGSFLLSDIDLLKKVITPIRETHKGIFTAKIRVGYKDDTNFLNVLSFLEDSGVDAITIHGRTRDEMYKGVAKWDYIKRAVQHVKSIPVVGNGDIWTTQDVEKYFDYTGAHSIMVARGAMKTPWLARLVKSQKDDSLDMRKQELIRYFNALYKAVSPHIPDDTFRIRKLKASARYSFDDFENAAEIKKSFLRAKSFEEIQTVLNNI